MTKRRRQNWQIGDYFLVPLINETFVIGQIIGQIKRALNSVICVFFDARVKTIEEAQEKIKRLSNKDIISARFVTRDLLDWEGPYNWKTFYNDKPIPMEMFFDAKKLNETLVGVIINGSGIIANFLNAFYGLKPWDMYYKPDYFDEFLVSPDKKPKKLLYKKDFEDNIT